MDKIFRQVNYISSLKQIIEYRSKENKILLTDIFYGFQIELQWLKLWQFYIIKLLKY